MPRLKTHSYRRDRALLVQNCKHFCSVVSPRRDVGLLLFGLVTQRSPVRARPPPRCRATTLGKLGDTAMPRWLHARLCHANDSGVHGSAHAFLALFYMYMPGLTDGHHRVVRGSISSTQTQPSSMGPNPHTAIITIIIIKMHLYYVVRSKQKQPMGTECISHSNTEDAVMCHTVSFHEAEQLLDNTVTYVHICFSQICHFRPTTQPNPLKTKILDHTKPNSTQPKPTMGQPNPCTTLK